MLLNETITIMKLPRELTTVTKLSKYLAMMVFVALPIVGFFLGMSYQEMIDLAKKQEESNIVIESKLSPSPIEIPTVDPSTANWKTYRNDEFGFEIRYPNDFQKDLEKDNYIKVYKPGFASLSISSILTNKNLEEYVDERIAATKEAYEGKPSLSVYKKISNTVAGKPSIQLEVYYEAAGTSGLEEYMANESNSIVEIRMMDLADSIESQIKKTFDQILSTFKFTQ